MRGHCKAPRQPPTLIRRHKMTSHERGSNESPMPDSGERRTLLLELACVLLKVVEALLSLAEHLR